MTMRVILCSHACIDILDQLTTTIDNFTGIWIYHSANFVFHYDTKSIYKHLFSISIFNTSINTMAFSNRFFTDAFRDMDRISSMSDNPNWFNISRSSFSSVSSSFGSFMHLPATNIHETPEGFELQVELPGYDKKDINIEVTDNRTLFLSGSSQNHHDAYRLETNKNPNYWAPRSSNSFQRSISFPVPINISDINASYENGVLKVYIPKASDENRRRINIH